MDTSTSIVSTVLPTLNNYLLLHCCSIGMDYSRRERTMPMDLSLSRMSSTHMASICYSASMGSRQCPILPGNSFLYDFDVPDQAGTFWYHVSQLSIDNTYTCTDPSSSPISVSPTRINFITYLIYPPANQYCDGLRGPMVIYDPDDPHKSLYDVDDGKNHVKRFPCIF